MSEQLSFRFAGENGARETSGAYGGPQAEWSPIPLQEIKAWLKANPDAEMESVFPTVYEEDRTAKIKDLATAQGLGYITHQRSAEQSAKELGFENYDYDEERGQIRAEAKLISPTELGVGDGIAAAVVGLPRPSPANGAVAPPAQATPTVPTGDTISAEPDPRGKRQDLSGPEQHAFRRQQKEAVDLVAEAAQTLRALREGMAQDTQTIVRRFEEVLTKIAETISAPVVHVHIPEPKPRRIKLTRDARGLMTWMEEVTEPRKPVKAREKSK